MNADEVGPTGPEHTSSLSPPASGLPTGLRLLCIGTVQPSWVSLTLQLDAEGCVEAQFRWVSTSGEAVTILRDESFDCLLVSVSTDEEGAMSSIEALTLLRAIRASGCNDPIVLLATRLDDEHWAQFCSKDCEVLITPNLWESLALVPMIKHAIGRAEMMHANHRLAIANHRRHVRERDEAEHLLGQQRRIIAELEMLTTSSGDGSKRAGVVDNFPATPPLDSAAVISVLPPEINDYYDELLRTYVIMGSGNLGAEIVKLAEIISLAGMSPREAMELHLERVEALVRGLGNRSARHVMARADLLALELMIHLGECYQKQCLAADA